MDIHLDVVFNLGLLAKLIDKASKNTEATKKFCVCDFIKTN